MLVATLGLALTVLVGCGDDYRNSASYGTTYGPDGRVYHRRIPGYVNGQSGYCGW